MLAIYCRISQDKEEGENRSIGNQKSLGIEMANKLDIPFSFYTDEGISGTLEDINARPGLKGLIGDIIGGKIMSVFITDQSRLERNPRVGFILKDLFQKHNIKLFTTTGEVDLKDPQVAFISNITSLINEFYVQVTQRKIKEVLEQKVRQGKIHGVLPYGYESDVNGYMTINEEEKEVVERIYSMSLNGVGTDKIAKILSEENIKTRYNKYGKGNKIIVDRYDKTKSKIIDRRDIKWAGKTVQGIIKNPIYKGTRTYSGKKYSCPAIFEKFYWQKVNANLKHNRNNQGKKVEHKYMLKGMLKCGRCGLNMYGRTRVSKKDNYYMCSSKRYCSANCKSRSINIDILEGFVWEQFFVHDSLLDEVIKYFSEDDDKKSQLKKKMGSKSLKLGSLEKERTNAIRLVIKGVLTEDDVQKEIARIDEEKNQIETELTKLSEQLHTLESSDIILGEIKNSTALSKNRNISWNDRRDLIKKHINSIKISYDDISHYLIEISLEIDPANKIYFVMDSSSRKPYSDLFKAMEIAEFSRNWSHNKVANQIA